MREAPALAMSSDRPARPRGPAAPNARPRPTRGKGKPASLLRRAFARPGVTVAGAVFAAVMTGIVTNAVMFQKGRHPSPLMGAPIATKVVDAPTPPRLVRHTAEAEQPAPLPIENAVPAPIQAPVVPAPRPSHMKAAAAPPKKPVTHGDPIRNLIANGETTAARAPSGKPAALAKTAAHPASPVHAAERKPRPEKSATSAAVTVQD